MNAEEIEKLKKAYPELVNQIEVKFPNSSIMIDKVLNSFGNKTQVEGFVKEILASIPNNEKEDKHYMNINNVNDLKRAYPGLVNQIISDALAEERNYNLEKSNKIREAVDAENNLINIAAGTINKGRRR